MERLDGTACGIVSGIGDRNSYRDNIISPRYSPPLFLGNTTCAFVRVNCTCSRGVSIKASSSSSAIYVVIIIIIIIIAIVSDLSVVSVPTTAVRVYRRNNRNNNVFLPPSLQYFPPRLIPSPGPRPLFQTNRLDRQTRHGVTFFPLSSYPPSLHDSPSSRIQNNYVLTRPDDVQYVQFNNFIHGD